MCGPYGHIFTASNFPPPDSLRCHCGQWTWAGIKAADTAENIDLLKATIRLLDIQLTTIRHRLDLALDLIRDELPCSCTDTERCARCRVLEAK
jgi:hypothetical protein